MSVLLAVDVGGSGMRSVECRGGVCNAVTTAAGARISTDGLDVDALLAATADVLAPDTDVLAFAARGIVTLADPGEFLERLVALGAGRTLLCSDAIAALVGAVGEVRPGAVVAAGTGAVALGCDFAGGVRRVDGWGHVLGDRGSAAWMGLEVLRRLLTDLDRAGGVTGADDCCADGADRAAGMSDDLRAAARQIFGPELRWPRLVMTRADAPALLASFAPTLSSLAEVGDPVASDICRRAGQQLAGSLAAAATDLPPGAVLSWTGGLLRAAPVRTSFLRAVAESGLRVRPPVGSSLDGALVLARAVADGREPAAHPPYLITG